MSRRRLLLAFHFLLLAALACSLPATGAPTPTPADRTDVSPTPSPTSLPPLPPRILETSPGAEGRLPVDRPLTLVFDQAMDRGSVEAAFFMDPTVAGEFSWPDHRTLIFDPEERLAYDQTYRVEIGTSARSAGDAPPRTPLVAHFQTAGFIEVTEVQPGPSTAEVDPTDHVRVAFNRPVVPLGLEGAGPQPLRFDPPVDGRGRWLGTSTYIFEAEPALPAGAEITVHIDEGLESPTGDILMSSYTWSFNTSQPRILESDPDDGTADVELDERLEIRFNQPMDATSVELGWALSSAAGNTVPGTFEWSDDGTSVTFTPNSAFTYNTDYNLSLEGVSARGGADLAGDGELSFRTIPRPAITAVRPAAGGRLSVFEEVRLTFSGPMEPSELVQGVRIEPAVESQHVRWSAEENAAYVGGDFEADASYRLTLSGDVRDPYGTPLGPDFSLSFRTTDLPPRLTFTRFHEVLTLTPSGPQSIELQARNLDRIDLTLRRLSMDGFLELQRSAVNLHRDPPAAGELVRSWQVTPPVERNVNHRIPTTLAEETSLTNGVYLLIADSPDDSAQPQGRLVVVRSAEIIVKSSPDETFLWGVDLHTGAPLEFGEVELRGGDGSILREARLDGQGTARLPTPSLESPYSSLYAQIGAADEDTFALTNWTWSAGIEPFFFGVGLDLSDTDRETYLYTDRPLYRPGDTVHLRGVVRSRERGGYQVPSEVTVDVRLVDPDGRVVQTWNRPLSAFGTFSADYELDASATLGLYSLVAGSEHMTFDVAAYRKPEFSVEVTASHEDRIGGQPLSAQASATFFSGGPVAEEQVQWAAYARPTSPPNLPQPVYSLGASGMAPGDFFGYQQLATGTGTTGPDGRFSFEVPTELEGSQPMQIVIEASIREPGGAPVTGRTEVRLHPAGIYLSVRPESYSTSTGAVSAARLYARDIHGDPVSALEAQVSVARVTWQQSVQDGEITWVQEEERVNRDTLTTGPDGTVLFSFAPQRSGTYAIEVEANDRQGRPARSRAHVWVRGEEAAVWRQPVAGRIQLVPDRETYAPGDRAEILIPSPYDVPAQALITIEGGHVLSHELVELPPNGRFLTVNLNQDHMPEAYLSVTLLRPEEEGRPAALSAGLVRLPVSAEARRLEVDLAAEPEHPAPGEQVRYHLQVRDSSGARVEAEFSMAVVDQALLALRQPNSPDPFQAFYGQRPLRVRTAASLTLSAQTATATEEGLGRGGGGGDLGPSQVRSQFEDTAYWEPSIRTDENGRATVSFTLPDNLTTWSTTVRGVTTATEVGEADHEFTVSKPLLIRPLTPRFFTAGDRSTVAAAVHNNTGEAISVAAGLQVQGASLDSESTHRVTVPPQSVERVEWTLNIASTDGVQLRFSVQGGGLQDASTATVGGAHGGVIPVIGYSVPDTAGTAGMLHEADIRLESISLPPSFEPERGGLEVTLEPSLGAIGLRGLAALEESDIDSTERAASLVLLNTAALRADQAGQIPAPQLERRVRSALQKLISRQNRDGGWGWWSASETNLELTAYTLHALLTAQEAGFRVPESTLEQGLGTLQATLLPPSALPGSGPVDHQALALFVLGRGGLGSPIALRSLADERESLTPRGQGLLLMALADWDPSAPEVDILLSALDSSAVLSATGAHWSAEHDDPSRLGGSVTTTSIVLQALLQADPDNGLIEPGIRWLVLARDSEGAWRSTHDTAWAAQTMMAWAQQRAAWTAAYSYQVDLNQERLADGRFEGPSASQSVQMETGIDSLRAGEPNALAVGRGAGAGTLGYTAHLTLYRPVDEVPPAARGLAVERTFYRDDGQCDFIEDPCDRVSTAQAGANLLVRLTVVVPADTYFVAVEDPYPAGLEPMDPGLETSAIRVGESSSVRFHLPWQRTWYDRAEIGDRSVKLFAEHLAAGTYEYVYRMHAAFPGTYRVLPAQTWATFLPEVFGRSGGSVFTVHP